MKIRNIIFGLFMPMLAGFLIGVNIVHLQGMQPGYEASWWKVGIHIIGGGVCWVTTQWRDYD
jgi:hypothetical protein